MKQKKLYERFIKYLPEQQLGNLASTLARLSSLSLEDGYDNILKNLLREATLLIEWCAISTPASLQIDLSLIQHELYCWYNVPLQHHARQLLAFRSRTLSDYLLQKSGLL